MNLKYSIFVLFLVSSVLGKPNLSSFDKSEKCGEDSFCTLFLLCNDNRTLVTDGSHVRDIRSVTPYPIECPHYTDVCCKVGNILPEVKPKSVPSAEASEDEKPPQCGFRNKQGLGPQVNTVDENQAKFGEFPWSLVVLNKEFIFYEDVNFTYSTYSCGASLIRPSVVLTAAHCVHNKDLNNLMVSAGDWNTENDDEPLSHVDVDVESIIIHKDFVSKNGFNDVALLFLKTPLTKGNHINTVCLPPQDMEFDNSTCFVSGWGKKNFRKLGRYSTILKKVEIPMMSNDVCENKLRGTRLGEHFNLHYSFICGGVEEFVCKGDGGSALVCPIDGQDGYYYQAGIVSWGIGCGGGIPGVHVKVSQFRNWIDDQIAAKYAAPKVL